MRQKIEKAIGFLIENLPAQARAYLDLIQKETGVPLSIVSVGAGREETIMIRNPFGSI